MHRRMPLIVCALLAPGLLAGHAGADPLRAPLKGDPALQMDAPPGWQIKRANMFGASLAMASTADRSGLVAVVMIPSGGAAPTLAAMAKQLAGAPFAAAAQSSPATLDGHAAEAFTMTQPPKGSLPERRLRFVIVRMDDHHIGMVVAITAAAAPDAERNQIEAAVAQARVIGPARPAK